RINSVSGTPGPVNTPPSFPYTVESKERVIYFTAVLNGDAENWFGRPVTSTPIDQSLSVMNLYAQGGTAELEVALQGATGGGHQVHVQLNGAEVGTVNFSDKEHKV